MNPDQVMDWNWKCSRWAWIVIAAVAVCHGSLFAQQTETRNESLSSPEANAGQSKLVAIEQNDVTVGLDLILNKFYLNEEFDTETFRRVWKVWPETLKAKAEKADEAERLEMAFKRYGLTPRFDNPEKPLQFVYRNQSWSMNCFTCHGGSLYGSDRSYPGLPNNRIALDTLYEDMRNVKKLLKIPFSSIDIGSSLIPMGTTVGTSNAVIFGVSLMSFRDKNLELKSFVIPPILKHHDMDAPPWWNYKHKSMLYIDGFTAKQHRALMPFIMIRDNDGKTFRGFENDFRKIEKLIESIEPPAYPHAVDAEKAAIGKKVFVNNCAHCHGTYGETVDYPEITVDLEEIGTDPVRMAALSRAYRKRYGQSWLAGKGTAKTISEPKGYVAPPLVGIWATAPYLHNGSVPTLRSLLDPRLRPKMWIRTKDGFNESDVGLTYSATGKIPSGLPRSEQRRYFDTGKYGKSNSGHDFGKDLSKVELNALLEYLKTL